MDYDGIRQKFIDVFEKNKNEYEACRKYITDDIELFIREQKKIFQKEGHNLLIVNSPESRVKDKDHFWSKFVRNGYINTWRIDKSWKESDYEQHLRENLTDLIGIRILCYFKEDEKRIYEALADRLLKEEKYDGFKPDHVEKKITGRRAHNVFFYKTQGMVIYKGKKFGTEIQLKSISNDLWSEVDHEIVYKAQQYQYDDSYIKEISNNIHNSLIASDNQLYELLNHSYKKEEVINSLFFLETEKKVFQGKFNDKINKLYHMFFDFYCGDEEKQLIKNYVAQRLLDKNPDLKKWEKDNSSEIEYFSKEFIEKYFSKKILQIKPIASTIYEYSDDNSFFNHISYLFLYKLISVSEEEIEGFEFESIKQELNLDEFENEIRELQVNDKIKDDYIDIFKGVSKSEEFKNKDFIQQENIKVAFVSLVTQLHEEK